MPRESQLLRRRFSGPQAATRPKRNPVLITQMTVSSIVAILVDRGSSGAYLSSIFRSCNIREGVR